MFKDSRTINNEFDETRKLLAEIVRQNGKIIDLLTTPTIYIPNNEESDQ